MKWNSEKLEDTVISQKFKHDMIRRLAIRAESSDIHQEWSYTNMCIAETAQAVLCKDRRKRNEDWYDDQCMSTGRRRMKQEQNLLNRNTRQNRELYKQKGKKKHIDCVEGRRERRLINKLRTYKIKTIINSTKNYIKVVKN
jgi:hypothetical protein